MTKQHKNFLISAVYLTAGGTLYVLLRPNTHIAKFFTWIPVIRAIRDYFMPICGNFWQFYLPDMLWGLALGYGLQAICYDSKWAWILCGVGAFLCGAVWELLQLCSIVPGIADQLDVVSYLIAGILCTIFNFKERKK